MKPGGNPVIPWGHLLVNTQLMASYLKTLSPVTRLLISMGIPTSAPSVVITTQFLKWWQSSSMINKNAPEVLMKVNAEGKALSSHYLRVPINARDVHSEYKKMRRLVGEGCSLYYDAKKENVIERSTSPLEVFVKSNFGQQHIHYSYDKKNLMLNVGSLMDDPGVGEKNESRDFAREYLAAVIGKNIFQKGWQKLRCATSSKYKKKHPEICSKKKKNSSEEEDLGNAYASVVGGQLQEEILVSAPKIESEEKMVGTRMEEEEEKEEEANEDAENLSNRLEEKMRKEDAMEEELENEIEMDEENQNEIDMDEGDELGIDTHLDGLVDASFTDKVKRFVARVKGGESSVKQAEKEADESEDILEKAKNQALKAKANRERVENDCKVKEAKAEQEEENAKLKEEEAENRKEMLEKRAKKMREKYDKKHPKKNAGAILVGCHATKEEGEEEEEETLANEISIGKKMATRKVKSKKGREKHRYNWEEEDAQIGDRMQMSPHDKSMLYVRATRHTQNPLRGKHTRVHEKIEEALPVIKNKFETQLIQSLGNKFDSPVVVKATTPPPPAKTTLMLEVREKDIIEPENIKSHASSFAHWKAQLGKEACVVYLEPNHKFSCEMSPSPQSRIFPLVTKVQDKNCKDVALQTKNHYIDFVDRSIKSISDKKTVASDAKIMSVLKEKNENVVYVLLNSNL